MATSYSIVNIHRKIILQTSASTMFPFFFYCFISLSHALYSEPSSSWHSSLSLPLSYDVVFMSAAFDNCQVETDSFNYFSKDPLFFMKRHLFPQNYLLLAHRSHGACKERFYVYLSVLGSLHVQHVFSPISCPPVD